MKNGQIYFRTIKFTFLRILLGLVGLIAAAAITAVGYFVTSRMSSDVNTIATVAAFIIGLIAWWLIAHYLGYLLKAGQIAMITKGVTEGELPDDVVGAGIAEVKGRFLTVNVYYAIANAISGITSELTRGINAAAGAIGSLTGSKDGNNVAGGIGAVISAFVSIILEYVNYCCLGWVFYKKDQNAFKSTCDGAVMYFQNWKTMLANSGKVFGVTIVSLIVIGGLLFMGFGAVLPEFNISAEELAEIDSNFTVEDLRIIVQAALALISWACVNAAVVTPYLLVSVMRKYIDKARETTVSFDLYEKLCGISKKFKKAFAKADIE